MYIWHILAQRSFLIQVWTDYNLVVKGQDHCDGGFSKKKKDQTIQIHAPFIIRSYDLTHNNQLYLL